MVIRYRNITPWLYISPALLTMLFFLIYPSIHTLWLSFFGKDSHEFVWFKNYMHLFTSESTIIAFRNNALWLMVFTGLTISIGLILALLLDRVRYERIVKSIIFLPMAVSMVGASVVWKFMYSFRPPGIPQIGLLNAIMESCGGQPVGWLIEKPWNNLFIIVVGVWIWTGFCLVVFSAAYKNIPREIIESARIDGANEWQVFWKIIIPMMGPTIAVVTTALIVFVLKIFDIVYVMSNGNFDTEVLANSMYKMFQYPDFGKASALAVILLVLIIPVMIINVRRFRKE
jgi:alpha-glucoside transport system permease protein